MSKHPRKYKTVNCVNQCWLSLVILFAIQEYWIFKFSSKTFVDLNIQKIPPNISQFIHKYNGLKISEKNVLNIPSLISYSKYSKPLSTTKIIDTLSQELSCAHTYGSIAILIVADSKAQQDYSFAIKTMLCYASKHNYSIFITDPNKNEKWSVHCSDIKDIMFQRHCITLQLLENYSWVAAFDGDVGVADPDKCIECLLNPNIDLVLEERFHNGEIQAGNYIVKNSAFSKNHLKKWIEYDKILTPFFHNADNGALHIHLISWFAEQQNVSIHNEVNTCAEMRSKAYDLNAYDNYVGCCMKILIKILPPNVRLIRRGHGFVRDLWVTDGKISQVDFFIHALKTNAGFSSSNLYQNTQSNNSCQELSVKNEKILNISEMQILIKIKDNKFKNERYNSIIDEALISHCWPHCKEYNSKL